MTNLPEARIRTICAEFPAFDEPSTCWGDSSCLQYLLNVARSFGVLQEVEAYQILDEDDRDLVLISVELRPGVFAHALPVQWREIRPPSGAPGATAIRDVLARLADIAEGVRVPHRDGGRNGASLSTGRDR